MARRSACLKAMSDPGVGGNAWQCLAGGTEDEASNVMGYGTKVSIRNSLPWLYRAPLHSDTHLADWRVTLGIRSPRRL